MRNATTGTSQKPRGLADLLLPYALIDDGILLQQDGSLLAGWSYRGPDMMSASAAEMDALERPAESVLAARHRLDGSMRCDSLPRARLSRARRFPGSGHAAHRR